MLKAPPIPTIDPIIADLVSVDDWKFWVLLVVYRIGLIGFLQAVATQCRFLRLGSPTGVTSCSIVSRLVAIREELIDQHKHEPAKAHLFTCQPLITET